MVADAIPYFDYIIAYSNYIIGLIITGIIVYISTRIALQSWKRRASLNFLVTLIGYIVYIVINTFISNTSRDVILIKAGIAGIAWLYLVKKIYGDDISWGEAFAIAAFNTIFISVASLVLPMFFRI
jgi:hypothetical protein